jgi:hypothetical protein
MGNGIEASQADRPAGMSAEAPAETKGRPS